MEVLVTGANGYLGLNLVKCLLQEGFNVTTLSKSVLPFNHKNMSSVIGDLIDINSLLVGLRIDIIFHVAASIKFDENDDAIMQLTRDNIIASERLAEFALMRSVSKVVYSSSCSVYEENYNPDYSINEEHKLRPRNNYALSKLAAEWMLADKLINKSVNLITLRYSSIYGGFQKRSTILSIFTNNAIREVDLNIFGTGKRTQDYVYIDDIVRANILCISVDLPFNTRLNIGSGQSICDLQLAEEIKSIFGSKSHIKILNTLSTKEEYFNYNIDKAKLMLGYEPMNLADGLKLHKKMIT
jgi:nucleoside-diphosphate-sugar epimerase